MANFLDENVIVLRFENKNFEKNVEASASALEKLNKSIENSMSTKADFEGLANSIKSVDVSRIADGVETASRRFKMLGVIGASTINTLTSSLITKLGGKVKNFITAVPKQAISGGWKRALNIEQAEFLIEGLGFKWKATAEELANGTKDVYTAVDNAVTGTRYALDEAAVVASQLLSSGVGMKDLEHSLKSISGLASVVNGDYSEIGRIFAQVAGQGRMMGDDLLQIQQRGIGAAAEIKKYLNANKDVANQAIDTAIAQGKQVNKMKEIREHAKLTEADVREMVSAGAISFDIFQNSFFKFFEQAEKANDTYEGSFANLKSAINRIGQTIEEIKLENFTKIFNTLLPVVKKFKEYTDPVAKQIGAISTKFTDFLNENVINRLGKAIGMDDKDLFHGFAKAVDEVGESSKKTGDAVVEQEEALTGLGKTVTGVMNLVKSFLNIIKGGVSAIKALKNTFSGVGTSLSDVFGTALFYISDKILNLSRTFASTMKKIANHAKGFSALIEKGNLLARAFKMLESVAKVFSSVLDRVSNGVRSFFKSIRNAGKEVSSSSKELSNLAKVFKAFSNLGKSVVNFFTDIGNAIKIVLTRFKGLNIEFKEFGDKGVGQFLSGVGGRLADWFLTISEKILAISEKFLKFTETMIRGGEAADKMTEKGTKLGKAIEKFKDIGTSVKDSFRKIGSAISDKTFVAFDKIESAFKSIKQTLSGFSGGSLIVGTFTAIANAFANFLSGLASGERTAGSFFSTIGSVLNQVLGVVSDVFSWILDKIGPAFDKFVEFFKQLSESEGVEKLKEAFSGLVDNMTGMAHSGFGVVVGWFKDLAGIAFGGGSLNNIVKFFSTLAGSIGTFIDKINKGENPFTGFFDTFKKTKEMMSFKFQIRDSVGAKFSEALNAPAIGASITQFKKLDVGGKTLKASNTLVDFITTLSNGFNAAALNGGLGKYLKELKEADLDKLSGLALKIVSVVGIIKSVKDMSSLIDSFVGVGKSISGFFGSLSGIANSISKSIKIEAFRTIAIAIGILVASIVALAAVPTDRLIPALAGVSGLLLSLVGIITLMNKPTFNPRKLMDIGVAFLGIGAGVFLLARACVSLAKIDPGAMAKAAVVIVGFMAAFVLASKMAGEVKKAGLSFMAMAVAVNLLVGAILMFALMPWATFVAGAKCVAIVIGILAVAARVAGTGAKGSVAFFAMAVALYALIPAIILMAIIPRDKAIQGAATISGVLLALGVAAKIAGAAKAGIKTMASMAGVIAVLTASLVVLSFIKPEALTGAVTSLVLVMGVLAAAGLVAKKALVGIWSIAGVIAVLTACIAALIALDPVAALQVTLSLSALALALGGACAIFAAINPVGALSALGSLSIFIAGLMLIIEGIAYIADHTKIESKIDKAKTIMKSIGEAFGSFFSGAITGATEDLPVAAENLKKFTDVLIPALDSLSNLADKQDSVKALKDLADAMLVLTGGGAIDKLSSTLGGGESMDFSKFGTSLTELAKSFVPFGQAVDEGLSGDAIGKTKKVGEAVKVFADVAGSLPKEGGIWQDISGVTQGVKEFVKGLEKVPESMKEMSDNAEDFDQEDIAKIQNVADAVTIMSDVAAALPKGTTFMTAGVAQGFTGYSNLKIFAQQLADFVPGFKEFSDACGAVGGEDTFGNLSRVKNVAAAVTAMAEAADSLPEGQSFGSGGVTQFFTGTASLKTFAQQLADFVPDFKVFSDACGAAGGDDTFGNLSRVKNVAAAVKAMAEAADSLPTGQSFTTSGVKQWFSGGKSNLSSFAKQLTKFIGPFKTFTDQLTSNPINTDALNQIPNISTAIKSMGDMAKNLPNTGGVKGFIFGNKDVAGFSKGVAQLAKGISGFAKNMQGVDVSGAEVGKQAASAIKGTLTNLNSIGTIKTYNNLPKVAANIASFVSIMGSVEVKGLASKASQIASASKNLARSAVQNLKGGSASSKSAGADIGNGFVQGIKSKLGAVASVAKSLGSKAASSAKSGADGMPSGGRNVGQGFVNGIRAKIPEAYSAGYALGRAAKRGQADATGESSPAKEFIKGGKFAGQGLVIGMKAYERKVYKGGYSLAAKSVDAANDAQDLFNANFNPVITPVVDMTNVQNGARQIDTMLSASRAMDINARVNSNPNRYETSGLVDKMISKFDDMTSKSLAVTVKNNEGASPSTNYFTFNVDGAENPEDFAKRFVRQVQLEMRT